MSGVNCPCGNFARYVNERSELCCALCPLRQNIESWRILDVPDIIANLRIRLADTQQQLTNVTRERDEAMIEVRAWRDMDIALSDSGV